MAEGGVAFGTKQAVLVPGCIAHPHHEPVVDDLTAAFTHLAAGHRESFTKNEKKDFRGRSDGGRRVSRLLRLQRLSQLPKAVEVKTEKASAITNWDILFSSTYVFL